MSDPIVISTVAELQRQYPDLCKMLVTSETSALNGTVAEMEGDATKATDKIKALEASVTEMTTKTETAEAAHEEATKRAETAESTVKEQAATVACAKVSDALSTRIDDRIGVAKQGDDKTKVKHEVAVMEMARKRFKVTADHIKSGDDDDHTLSVKAAEAGFDAECSEVRKLAEDMGVSLTSEGSGGDRNVRETARRGTRSGDNPDRTAKEDRLTSLLPSYKRQKDGWKDKD